MHAPTQCRCGIAPRLIRAVEADVGAVFTLGVRAVERPLHGPLGRPGVAAAVVDACNAKPSAKE
jgi:hypothetical protein